jgi:2OG-Fe(II) oxygenase superfamily
MDFPLDCQENSGDTRCAANRCMRRIACANGRYKILIHRFLVTVVMLYREFQLPGAAGLNARLYERFMALLGTNRVNQTHHFGGRFENIYIAVADIPEVRTVLRVFRQQAGEWLGMAPHVLKAGFWFNAMEYGQRTSLHHHDENDELLSAAYYICVPEQSGDLVLHEGDRQVIVRPREGKLVLFSPALLHEVTTSHSHELRLSIGMNIGPAAQEQALP